ncbi:vomeronasal type-2 receptor 26-like [Pelodytes ibericus]
MATLNMGPCGSLNYEMRRGQHIGSCRARHDIKSYLTFFHPAHQEIMVECWEPEMINLETDLLPNITLGYHLYDSCLDTMKAVKSVLQILSGPRKTVPNYSCMGYNKVAGFIGDHHSLTTVPIAQVLGVYGYPQISYGATDYGLSDRRVYPHFFRMVQNDRVYYKIIARLLKHFSWTWVGILASNDDSGETDSNFLGGSIPRGTNFLEFPDGVHYWKEKILSISVTCPYRTIPSTIVWHYPSRPQKFPLRQEQAGSQKTLSAYGSCGRVGRSLWPLRVFAVCRPNFIMKIMLMVSPEKAFLHQQDLQKTVTNNHKTQPKKGKPSVGEGRVMTLEAREGRKQGQRPMEDENLALVRKLCGSWVIGVAAKKTRLRRSKHIWQEVVNHVNEVGGNNCHMELRSYILQQNLTDIFQTDYDLFFDEMGELSLYYLITNWCRWPNMSALEYNVGSFTEWLPEDQQLTVWSESIIWKNKKNQIPRSQCSDNCLPGYRKVQRPREQSCCYDCAQCPEGEISNRTDSENCIQCPYTEWPNEKKDQCIPRLVEFLSYNNNTIAAVFMFVSVLFFIITFVTLVIFVSFRDTPIVRANNKSLSFVLLVSIMLSFLCVFLFLGRPVDITCMLRQSSFAVIFSLAISSVMGKTIMIYIVFKAARPGGYLKHWVSIKTSSSIVVIFSSIQVIINIIWLTVSPPFQELDIMSYPGKMIIQCNEGSVIAFYTVLGYMGFLAAVSFIIAYLARTLPDSFNEAKYITFSMLVFCSVWIAMIPAYLSTKVKDMVAVEIFAILTSSAGLLGCIFFPKCYIILFRPEMNTKTILIGSKKRYI